MSNLHIPVRDKLYLTAKHFYHTKRFINWKNPSTLTEKMQVLKYTDDRHMRAMCADKYAVREFVTKRGLSNILNELYMVSDSAEIDFDALPNQFVLKCTNGCGLNIICLDKNALNQDEARATMDKWLKLDFAKLIRAEPHYSLITSRIIAERFLPGLDSGLPDDFKIYCVHGSPRFILHISGRGKDIHKQFYDTNWNLLGVSWYNGHALDDTRIPKPPVLDELLAAAAALSQGFPFARMDFYWIDGKVIFGEMTFTPVAGFMYFKPERLNLTLAEGISVY